LVPKRTVFDYALAANRIIGTNNAAGTGLSITGQVASKEGPIDDTVKEAVGPDNWRIDETLYFPPIVPPLTYNQTFPAITSDTTLSTTTGLSSYFYATGISGNSTTITVTGKGDAHLYIDGNIDMGPHAGFVTQENSRLYVYVIGNRTVNLRGTGTDNQVFIYAPDSNVEWQNANSHRLLGSIIANTIILHNHTSVVYNGGLSSNVNLDRRNYIWIDE
jgi:hypothetical protein